MTALMLVVVVGNMMKGVLCMCVEQYLCLVVCVVVWFGGGHL